MSSEQTITIRLEDSPLHGLKYARPDQMRHYAADVNRRGAFTAADLLNWLADEVERQTKPSKPDEPTGLGAVVEDTEGRRWTRTRSHDHGLNWREEWGGRWKTWVEFDAVRKLSDGVKSSDGVPS